jgi:hypothetical protein
LVLIPVFRPSLLDSRVLKSGREEDSVKYKFFFQVLSLKKTQQKNNWELINTKCYYFLILISGGLIQTERPLQMQCGLKL